ncbi:transcriptional repressor general negative regulator of transcription subunit 4 [Microsporum ferrugineum]
MSSRALNDSVIDDDDELCPLCIEEFDLSDKNFKPCPCGYQICQFCYNNIKTHSEEGRCPNCRRVYDESNIQYRVPDVDEFKADLALKHRKAAAAKRKEAEKREIEASSRKNLAGVRVVQKNLVYVIGLNPTIRDENLLLQTLRGDQYFGQYGDIDKIVVSKAKPGGNPNQGIGVYVTFARKIDAATCIAAVDGSPNGDRVLRAQYGTTKYCSSFLRNESCNNRNCTFLHETGNDSDSFSRQDLSSMNTISSQRFPSNGSSSGNPQTQNQRPSPATSHARAVNTQNTQWPAVKDDGGVRASSADSSALPSSASWANRDSLVQRTRRESIAASRSSPSPKPTNEAIASRPVNGYGKEPQRAAEQPSTVSDSAGLTEQASTVSQPTSPSPTMVFDKLVKAVNSPEFRFHFSTAALPDDELAFIENHPSLIDPYGGVKRRAMREKAEQERAKHTLDGKLLQAPVEEENLESGSSQLGGEPEESHGSVSVSGRHSREPQSAIQPPSQQATANNSVVGSPVSNSHQFQSLNVNARNLSQLQQQQLMLLKSAGGQQHNTMDLQANTTSGTFDQNARTFQNQMAGLNNIPGHTRQSSRFSFAYDVNSKNSNSRLLGSQGPMMQSSSPNPLSIPTTQHNLGNQYFVSGIQGPPPGLKSAGTPPVSGGGMFAQGHGFTSTMNNNLGLGTKQDGNADLMREIMRARGAASGSVQSHDATKREFMFPLLQQNSTPPPLAPVSGLLNPLYGQQLGLYQDQVPQKQKKRGKKHRHANTSSGGGGVVDLADPSILQARMHQGGANAATGQGLYGSQGQEDEDFPPLAPASKPNYDKQSPDTIRFPTRTTVPGESSLTSSRSGTPAVPPGFSLPHAHPSASFVRESRTSSPSLPKTPLTINPPPGLVHPQALSESNAPPESAKSSFAATFKQPTNRAAEISLGSPKPKASSAAKTATLAGDAPMVKAQQSSHGKSKPLKLDLSTFEKIREPLSHSSNSVAAPTTSSTGPESRPNTPGTNSRTSNSPAPRQPRVLRVVDTPKSEPVAPTIYASTSVWGSKQRPGVHGLSSVSRPTTPAGSEYDAQTSASVSRANSPPPSRIGSAPVRSVTKSQVKKDRKLKAKNAEAKKDEMLLASTPTNGETQAPIIGRKRKTKKAPKQTNGDVDTNASDGEQKESSGIDTAKAQPEPSSSQRETSSKTKVANQEEPKKQEQKTTVQNEPWRENNTLQQMTIDAEAKGIPVKDLFLERTAPLPTLLGQLQQLEGFDLNAYPLFNPPNLGQRTDMKCNADDYDMLHNPLELTEEHRKQLLHGEPVRINTGDPDKLKHRALITPTGCILRHLSAEEEDRYLALEKNLSFVLDVIQDSYPSLLISEPDITNRGGGLDALFATPEKFNICWVDEDSTRNGLVSSITADGSSAILSNPLHANSTGTSTSEPEMVRSHNWAISSGGETVPVRSSASKSMMGGRCPSIGPGLEELMNMSDAELRAMISTSQAELDVSRREVDAIDKKIMALVKRNKKLVQQALAAAQESIGSSH